LRPSSPKSSRLVFTYHIEASGNKNSRRLFIFVSRAFVFLRGISQYSLILKLVIFIRRVQSLCFSKRNFTPQVTERNIYTLQCVQSLCFSKRNFTSLALVIIPAGIAEGVQSLCFSKRNFTSRNFGRIHNGLPVVSRAFVFLRGISQHSHKFLKQNTLLDGLREIGCKP
jgi:hypothetical protein